jgi:DNA segregation ATPase FtsK/SpoIIIE, S-DNA-T family
VNTDPERDNVVPLRPGTAVEPKVFDAEIAPAESVSAAGAGQARGLVKAARTVMTVRPSERTVAATKGAVTVTGRVVVPILQGHKSWAVRAAQAMTYGHVREQIRRAKAAGDAVALAEWTDRLNQLKRDRVQRVKDLPAAMWAGVKAVLVAVTVLAGILAVLGLWFQFDPGGMDWLSWWALLGDIAGVVGVAVTLLTHVVLYGGIPAVLIAAWREGNRRTDAGWLRTTKADDRDGGALVTADGIVHALQHLNISAMNKAFKNDWMPRFELTPVREGSGLFKGYRAIFDLPPGVTPNMVADKGDVLATNLHRNAVEVWPSDYGKQKGGKPGFVNLYVADAGIMDKPTPQYPLMHSGTADVFAGVPVGITQRGDMVIWPLNGSNFVFGGQPGQGKSNAVRVVFAGAALDSLAELRVHVFAGNGDFDAYAPRLSRYHKGASPEHAQLATEHLRELFEEVGRREQRLAELGAKKLTRALAEQHPDLRPIIAVFSECHELFGDESCGEEAAELSIRTVKRGRKTGVVLGFDTQSSRTDAIPSQLVENVGTNGCFAVKTWRSNDGFLGDGSFAAGIRATELRFNVDRGTMVATGVSDELFEIVRTYFIEVNDDTGWDAATDIIERAMTVLAAGTPVSGDRPVPEIQTSRDLLSDIDTVLDGSDPVPAGEVIGALRTLAPTWRDYKDLTVRRLVAALATAGVKVPSTGNKWPIDPVTVRDALARHATADLDCDTVTE